MMRANRVVFRQIALYIPDRFRPWMFLAAGKPTLSLAFENYFRCQNPQNINTAMILNNADLPVPFLLISLTSLS